MIIRPEKTKEYTAIHEINEIAFGRRAEIDGTPPKQLKARSGHVGSFSSFIGEESVLSFMVLWALLHKSKTMIISMIRSL